MEELQDGTAREFPPGTEHLDLVAQLAARIALDTVDRDQRSDRVADRDLSRDEWRRAATELSVDRPS